MGLDVPSEYDQLLTVQGVPFMADPRTFPFLEHMKIGFTTDAMGEGFTVDSAQLPPAGGACGCGHGHGEGGCGCGHHSA